MFSRTVPVLVSLVCLLHLVTSPVFGATVTIDQNQTFQTIEGFGAFAQVPVLYRPAGQFWDARPQTYDLDRYSIDLGASVARFELTPTAYPVQGRSYSWDADVFGAGSVRNQFKLIREMKKRGIDRAIFSVWSPPCWMKYSKDCTNGNALDPAYYDEFAKYLADYCKVVKDSTGVEPFALSIQNEPQFAEPYNSCVYSDAQLIDVADRTATKLTAAGLSTKIFGAEHMMAQKIGPYTNFVKDANLYAFAVHGYQEGITADYGSAAAWADLKNQVGTKQLWMTETTSPASKSYMDAAKALHGAIASGKLSLWTWWAYADNMGTFAATSGVNTSWTPHGTYYATKHWARFVRPGATMVGCTSSPGTLWSSAFKNTDGSIAVVIINTGSGTEQVTVSGGAASYTTYTTNATKNCQPSGASTGTVSIDGNSIVTLLSGTAAPVLGADTTAPSIAAPIPSTTLSQLNMFGDDTVDVYINGVRIGVDRAPMAKSVALLKGQNVIACKLVNKAWGGGLIGAMLLPGGDTLRTDSTWKLTIKEPAAGWTDLAFDDAAWRKPHDFGKVNVWPGFEKWGTAGVNFYYWNAKWICGATKTYFRKEFTGLSGTLTFAVVGNNMKYQAYVNGTAVGGQRSEFSNCTPNCIETTPVTQFTTSVSGTTCIAFELTDAGTNGNGVLFRAMVANPGIGSTAVAVDATWKCWDDSPQGWNTVGFDDAAWIKPAVIDAYDAGKLSSAKFIYPNTFWYRKVFTSAEGMGLGVTIRPAAYRSGPSHLEYYNLRGQKMAAGSTRISHAHGVTIQRAVTTSGSPTCKKIVMAK